MSFPTDIGIIDTMIGFPHADMAETYAFITPADPGSRVQGRCSSSRRSTCSRTCPRRNSRHTDDPIGTTLREMDAWGIEKGMINVSGGEDDNGPEALKGHPDRFFASTAIDPNRGHGRHPRIARLHDGVRHPGAVDVPLRHLPASARSTTRRCTRSTPRRVSSTSPSSVAPAYPDRGCKLAPQHVELIDEVMYDFPELTFVTRHGCEPWTASP